MDEIEKLLTRRVDKIYPSKEVLEKVLRSGKKLRLYQGFDPSSPVLHIGHLCGLKKLADFQKAGHEVIFLIGDFTGMIGDPSGKANSRQILTHEQVMANAKEYQKQAGRVLKFDGPNPVKIKFNSEWNSKLSIEEFLHLAANVTALNMWERDMFQERLKNKQDIWFHEMMYPLIQGYDSVAMDVDLEVGGSDQMFNMMVGRELMKKIKNKEKFVLTTPLLTDAKGTKIGKTEGNAIAIADPAEKLFTNIMSLPDEVVIPAMELITDMDLDQVSNIKNQKSKTNPMELKKLLAFTVVAELNDEAAALQAQKEFERVVQKGEAPTDISVIKLPADWEKMDLPDLLFACNLVKSKSEGKRLIEQKAVDVEGNTIKPGVILKIGKRIIIKLQ